MTVIISLVVAGIGLIIWSQIGRINDMSGKGSKLMFRKILLSSLMDYTSYGIKHKWCFSDSWDAIPDGDEHSTSPTICNLHNPRNSELLIISDETVNSVNTSIKQSNTIDPLTQADRATPLSEPDIAPLKFIDVTLDVAALQANSTLSDILKDARVGAEIQKVVFHLEKVDPLTSLTPVPSSAGAGVVKVRIELRGSWLDRVFIESQILVYPVKLSSYALILPRDLRLDKPGLSAPDSVYIPPLSTTALSAIGAGIFFHSPVFINRDLYIASSASAATTGSRSPVTFEGRVVFGGGTLKMDDQVFKPDTTSASPLDLLWSKITSFGGFKGGLDFSGNADAGLDAFINTVVNTSFKDREIACQERIDRAQNLQLTGNSALLVRNESTAASGTTFDFRLGLSNKNRLKGQPWAATGQVSNKGATAQITDPLDPAQMDDASIQVEVQLSPHTVKWDGSVVNIPRSVTMNLPTGVTFEVTPDPYPQPPKIPSPPCTDPAPPAAPTCPRYSTDQWPFPGDRVGKKVTVKILPYNLRVNCQGYIDGSEHCDSANDPALAQPDQFKVNVVIEEEDPGLMPTSHIFEPGYPKVTVRALDMVSHPSSEPHNPAYPVTTTGFVTDRVHNNLPTDTSLYSITNGIDDAHVTQLNFDRAPASGTPPVLTSMFTPTISGGAGTEAAIVPGTWNVGRPGIVSSIGITGIAPASIGETTSSSTNLDGIIENMAQEDIDCEPQHESIFGAADQGLSFTDQTRAIWLFHDPSAIPTKAARGAGLTWNPLGNGAPVTLSPAETNGNFLIKSIVGTCIVDPAVSRLNGFFVCDRFVIPARTSPLTIIGTVIAGDISIDPSAVLRGIHWYSVFHSDALNLLRAPQVLTTGGTQAVLGPSHPGTCEDPQQPAWSQVGEYRYENLKECSVESVLETAEPFNWTQMDPDCGPVRLFEQACKQRVINYSSFELSRLSNISE